MRGRRLRGFISHDDSVGNRIETVSPLEKAVDTERFSTAPQPEANRGEPLGSTRRWNHSLPRVHADHEAQAEKLEKLFTVSGSQTMNNFSNFHNPTCTEDTPAQRTERGRKSARLGCTALRAQVVMTRARRITQLNRTRGQSASASGVQRFAPAALSSLCPQQPSALSASSSQRFSALSRGSRA